MNLRPDPIYVFDSSYPSNDIAVPIDEARLHVIVSDREIEPPPRHRALNLDGSYTLASMRGNIRKLRELRNELGCERCIVIASGRGRPEQLFFNLIYALASSRRVALFDGVAFHTLRASSGHLLKKACVALIKLGLGNTLRKFKARRERSHLRKQAGSIPVGCRRSAALFGVYTSDQSFPLPPDPVSSLPDGPSLYGRQSYGWYLPAFSHRRQRYEVQTSRHLLRDVTLHAELVAGAEVSSLFHNQKILDYPYMLGWERKTSTYTASTCSKEFSIPRAISLLAYSSGYYHWILEGVPRILDVLDEGWDLGRYPLVLPPLANYQLQTLHLLGIDPERQVVTVAPGDWCQVEECVLPTIPFPFGAPKLEDPSGQPSCTLLNRIRTRILARLHSLQPPATGMPRKLYISRAQAAKRKFTAATEDAVSSILERHGYTTVCLEELDWTTQVQLLAGAHSIAGFHGAGLANILFSNATSLIEFHNPMETRAYFAVIARELGIDYSYVIGELDGTSERYDNITLDADALERLMSSLRLDQTVTPGQLPNGSTDSQ